MTARRSLAALGAVLALLGLLVSPASAGNPSPQVVADPKGDGHGVGDVRAIRVAQAGSDFYVQVRLEAPTNFGTVTWRSASSQTLLRFNLDTNGDTTIEGTIFVQPNPGGVESYLQGFEHSPRAGCDVTLTRPQQNLIRVRMPITCLNGATGLRAFARFRFDRGGDGSIDSDDRAPNARYTPAVAFV